MSTVDWSAPTAWDTKTWDTSTEAEIARKVQTRLLQPHARQIHGLELGAWYQPARVLGGDFYDFLSLGPSKVGLLVGDVSGKGVGAALMMASLQASLRTHLALTTEMTSLLESVNQLFCETTARHHFATLFLGQYEESSRRLRYVNCGHHPPLLVRRDLTVQRLTSTATVLGIFRGWECGIDEVTLEPGDTLLLYTDGMTETTNGQGQEYGEAGLLDSLRSHQHLSLGSLIQSMVHASLHFRNGPQEDDQTLVVARPRLSLEPVQ